VERLFIPEVDDLCVKLLERGITCGYIYLAL